MDFYQNTLDAAVLDIGTGIFSYDTVLKRIVNQMTNSGLRWIDYDSGHHNRVEVAARRAVMTGFTQVQSKINEQTARRLGTDYYEVSYHIGARPEHQVWQGRVYSHAQLVSVCGLGTVTGLCGANCYHWYDPFVPGVSVRTYTDQQLEEMMAEENTPKEYDGKSYTTYEALQHQRKMETLMRKQRQDIRLLKEGEADADEILAAQSRYRSSMAQYADFSEAMKLPQQMERVYMDGLSGNMKRKAVAKPVGSDIIKSVVTKEVTDVHAVGRIDKEIYKCITEDIRTDEVIISDERIGHIKTRHPNDYERFYAYIPGIIQSPDYIIEANKENTGVLLKEITESGEKFKLVLRIAVKSDPDGYKNSVISFWHIGDTTWRKMIKNKKILYRKE